MTTDTWLVKLRENGCRLTEGRRAVVDVIQRSTRALTPIEVFDRARESYRALGLVSVYRTLEALEEQGLVQRVHQPGGCNAYLPHAEGHQHLIICQECGRAEYFEGDDLDAFFERVAGEHGYTVKEHWLQLFGVCSACSK